MKFPILRMLSFLVGYLDSLCTFLTLFTSLRTTQSEQPTPTSGRSRSHSTSSTSSNRSFFPKLQNNFPPPRYGSGSDSVRFLGWRSSNSSYLHERVPGRHGAMTQPRSTICTTSATGCSRTSKHGKTPEMKNWSWGPQLDKAFFPGKVYFSEEENMANHGQPIGGCHRFWGLGVFFQLEKIHEVAGKARVQMSLKMGKHCHDITLWVIDLLWKRWRTPENHLGPRKSEVSGPRGPRSPPKDQRCTCFQDVTRIQATSSQVFGSGQSSARWRRDVLSAGWSTEQDIWVCLKMVSTPKANGFADHYPYEKWLFHWGYTPFSDIPTSQRNVSKFTASSFYTPFWSEFHMFHTFAITWMMFSH